MKFSIFLLLTLALLCNAQNRKQRERNTAEIAKEFSNMAREIRVSRNIRDQLEDQALTVEYALKHQQLTPAEHKKISAILNNIEKMRVKARQKGSMTPAEAKNIQREISNAYRLIWFMRKNKNGKTQKIHFLGRELQLRSVAEQQQYESGKLNQKQMQDILRCYYKACRIAEKMRVPGITPQRKKHLEKECFKVLSEHFILAQQKK